MTSAPVKLSMMIVYANGNGRHKTVTNAVLRFGPLTLATVQLPGKWEEPQIIAEYKKNPAKFKLTEEGQRFPHLIR